MLNGAEVHSGVSGGGVDIVHTCRVIRYQNFSVTPMPTTLMRGVGKVQDILD